jgi:hypothetical protein
MTSQPDKERSRTLSSPIVASEKDWRGNDKQR